MARPIALILIISAAAAILLAQAAPQPSELQRMKLLSSYSRAVLLQQEAASAQQRFEGARADYTKLADDVAAELKLPKQSQFIIDVQGQKVTVQLPAPEAAKAPAPPAPAEKK